MTEIITEAGKRLHDARHLPDYCSDPCELREEVAAIEAEAYEKGHACAERTSAAAAALHRKEARAAVLARLRERVEGLGATVVTNAKWDARGVLTIEHDSLGTGTQMLDRAAVLAIIEEEEKKIEQR